MRLLDDWREYIHRVGRFDFQIYESWGNAMDVINVRGLDRSQCGELSRSPTEAYGVRWQRVMDCVNLRQPDRMPVAFFPSFWLAKYGGISCKELMYDYEKTAELLLSACLEFQPDLASSAAFVTYGPLFDLTGFRQMEWPGHGVDEDSAYQYLDREYMKAEEYDDFLFDPTGFYLNTYLSRVATVYGGLRPIASLTSNFALGLLNATGMFATPEMEQAFAQLTKAGQESHRFSRHMAASAQELAANGFPLGFGAVAVGPYDVVADFMRGATGMMKDLFRHGETVLKVLEKIRVLHGRGIIAQARMTGNPFVFVAVHWAPDAFMSQKQFETFWWPSFRRMLIDLIDAELIPVILWEGDCTKRLRIIRDIPEGKCVYWFERTDMVKAFETVGDVVALRGNLSASVMTTGTSSDVDAAVKHLVDNVWNRGGKLILDCAVGLSSETPVENVRAMFDAARKYA